MSTKKRLTLFLSENSVLLIKIAALNKHLTLSEYFEKLALEDIKNSEILNVKDLPDYIRPFPSFSWGERPTLKDLEKTVNKFFKTKNIKVEEISVTQTIPVSIEGEVKIKQIRESNLITFTGHPELKSFVTIYPELIEEFRDALFVMFSKYAPKGWNKKPLRQLE